MSTFLAVLYRQVFTVRLVSSMSLLLDSSCESWEHRRALLRLVRVFQLLPIFDVESGLSVALAVVRAWGLLACGARKLFVL